VKTEPGRYVLDSFAVLAYLEDETGAGRVSAVLESARQNRASVWMSIVNYGEVVYITEREQGLFAAQRAIAAMDQLPMSVVDADRKLTLSAARVKAHHGISYADAFAIALAQAKQAAVLTGDPEFRKVETLVAIDWLPADKTPVNDE